MGKKRKIIKIPDFDKMSEADILELRMCDLGVVIEKTPLQDCVAELYSNLEEKGMRFRPPCYLGDEWFSPADIPAVAIPFYLTHNRLKSLENKMMHECEGGTHDECMKLLRHECGHAAVHAFHFTRRPLWKRTFGSANRPFQDYYRYRPYSRSYVQNIKQFYAQSHPEEDFAETFAVWLDPKSNWQEKYIGWPALKKLEYVDKLMQEFKDREVRVAKKDFYYLIDKMKGKLRIHYEKRRKIYSQDEEDFFDRDLELIFGKDDDNKKHVLAERFIRKNRGDIEQSVAKWTRERKFMVKKLITTILKRCSSRKIRIYRDEKEVFISFTSYITSLISSQRYTSRYKG